MSIGKDAAPEWGPKMQALSNDRRRAFVCALYDEQAPMKGDGLLIYAARKAGYGNKEGTTTNESLGVIGARLVQDESVHDAIAEYSRNLVRVISPEAVRAVRNLIRNPKAKDHARAVGMILDRIAPVETTHTLKVEDNRPPSREAMERVLARIDELAVRAGVMLPAIKADYRVVNDDDA
jgi:phage terminase small subunit